MSSLLTTFLLLTWINLLLSQHCSNRVAPLQYLASPSAYRGVCALTLSVCSSNSIGFNCPYSVILGDNEPVPLQPNLENSGGGNSDVGKFLVWPNSTERPYMSFGLGNLQSVTAINIEFLNYPAQGFSLPNLELYSTSGFFVTDSTHSSAQRIEFELRNNDILSRGDYRVTNVSLNFSRSSSTTFLLHWNYTRVYNLNFFMVSEVDFCNDPQPPDETPITFQDPQSDNSVIIPTVEEFIGTTNTTLNCTVSSSGLFEWRWRQDGSMISNTGKFSIFTADGTRTTILQITGLNVSDAAEYTCEVRRRGGGEYMSRIQTLSFPVIVDLPGPVTGYLVERQAMLTCDVHEFLRSTNPPVWLGRDGNPIDSNAKYTIALVDSSRVAVLLSNGSSVPGWRSTLTINQLGMADEGTYTCMVDGNSATVQLTVVAGSAPPTITLHIQKGSATTLNPATSLNEPRCTQSVVVAIVSSLITATIVFAITIVIHFGVWFYKKSRSNETGRQAHQGSSNEGVYETADDKAAKMISTTTNEAYATTTTM